jgi:hypothetical protein
MRGERMNPLWPLPENRVASENIAVVFDGGPTPIKYRARWYHYVAAWFWNLYRKPLVIKKQKLLRRIFDDVKADIADTLLPELWERRHSCVSCFNAYTALKPQVFLSQIEMILTRMECAEHPRGFRAALFFNGPSFRKSEELARWVNGL